MVEALMSTYQEQAYYASGFEHSDQHSDQDLDDYIHGGHSDYSDHYDNDYE